MNKTHDLRETEGEENERGDRGEELKGTKDVVEEFMASRRSGRSCDSWRGPRTRSGGCVLVPSKHIGVVRSSGGI
jgi:hypothetical protein